MVLTKIELDMSQRAARTAIGDCQEMHRLLNGLFDCPRGDAQLLYRVRSAGHSCAVYLYSSIPIEKAKLLPFMTLAGEKDVTAWAASMGEGTCVSFDILTSPTKKVPQALGKNSQRRVLRSPEERMAWLCRKASENGFGVLQVQELEPMAFFGTHRKNQGGKMFWNAFHYHGTLRITDAALFQKVLMTGLGPGKAYGLGMLLLS